MPLPPSAAARGHHVIGGLRRADGGDRQVRVPLGIEPRRAALDAGQHQVTDTIGAQRANPQRLLHGPMHDRFGEVLHQPQNLHEFPLARRTPVLLAQPRLEQAAQRGELLGQVPVLQRGRLIQRANLLLEQRQIVQRIEDEVRTLIGAPVPGDLVSRPDDHHLVYVALHDDLPVRIGHRNRVVVVPVTYQRLMRRAALETRPGRWSQASKGTSGSAINAARSFSSRSAMIPSAPRRATAWRPLQRSRSIAFSAARSDPQCRAPRGSAP